VILKLARLKFSQSAQQREKGRYIHTQKQKIFVPTTLAGILVVVVVKKYVEGGGGGGVRKK
jgi:hypothetical protein